MRAFLTVAICVLAIFSAVYANEVKSDAQPRAASRLDAVIRKWHAEMEKIQSLSCQLQQTSLDRVYQATQTREGTITYLKPDYAALEWRKKGAKTFDERCVYDGKLIYLYNPDQHAIGAVDKDSFIFSWMDMLVFDRLRTLFVCADPAEMQKRYELKLLEGSEWYFFVLLTPRAGKHAADFTRARLTLRKDNYLPRQLWIEEA